jgi:CO/xanthine dehydrogenase FAD-binding subunit
MPGDAWLAGGTWLFSEPQAHLARLIDLDGFGWPDLARTEAGLEIAATCRVADLHAFVPPAEWPAASLFRPCCESLLASFKIWNMATVGGNLCLALPTGALITLTAALEGTCTIWQPEGGERSVPVIEFVTDLSRTVLRPGELLRAITLPAVALHKPTAFRRTSPSRYGRASVLLIGTRGSEGSFSLTIGAATRRPIQLEFAALPRQEELRGAIDAAVTPELYFDDADATSTYRRHMTHHLAGEVRQALADEAELCRSP